MAKNSFVEEVTFQQHMLYNLNKILFWHQSINQIVNI